MWIMLISKMRIVFPLKETIIVSDQIDLRIQEVIYRRKSPRKTGKIFPGRHTCLATCEKMQLFVFSLGKQLASCFLCIPHWQMESLSLMSVLSLSSWHISMSLMSWCYTSAKPLMTSLSPLLSSVPLWKNRGKLKWCVWIMDPMTRPPLWSSFSLFLKQSY